MEPSSIVQGLSLSQTPRPGQLKVLELIKEPGTELNIKLPTGYGKTFTAYAAYMLLRAQNRVNGLLFIVPTDAQLGQIVDKSETDFDSVGLTSGQAVDMRFFGTHAMRKYKAGKNEVFVITVQSLKGNSKGLDAVKDLMNYGRFMVVVDEYHHYGIGKKWGDAVKALPSAFMLAMSATPDRPGQDSAFGAPDSPVSYCQAVSEKAVKPLRGHSYIYRIDAITAKGEVISYTTSELIDEAGGEGEAIEKLKIDKQMRWSPKYISPLVSEPLERLHQQRIETGRELRAIIGAMSVSHAELVCKQVEAMFQELRVDWVGTWNGEHGRPQEKNKAVIERFLADEFSPNALDVLVHVGMAGEGLDSTLVSEVVHLNAAKFNNSNKQENGRAARYLESVGGEPVIGNINFDSSSEFAVYTHRLIEKSMDDPLIAIHEPDPDEPPEQREYQELPDEPAIKLVECELVNIDHGAQEIRRMDAALRKADQYYNNKPKDDHETRLKAVEFYKAMREDETESFNELSKLAQTAGAVNGALSRITGLAMRTMQKGVSRQTASTAGDIKTRINQRKCKQCGRIDKASEAVLLKHYHWLKDLESEILECDTLPGWLI